MQDTTMVMTKRKQTYLSNKERWEVAKWLIENRCVVQDIHAYPEKAPVFIPFTLWRVKKITAVAEINRELSVELTSHHLDQSIAFYNEMCDLTGSHPNVPAIQDTVEMDMLTAECARLNNDIKEVTKSFENEIKRNKELMAAYTLLFENMRKIANLIPAELFGKKSPK